MRIDQSGNNSSINDSFNKRNSFRIGNVNLGLGHLAVAAVILVGGGSAAAVVANQSQEPAMAESSPVVRQAAGTWQLAGSQQVGMFKATAGTLTISPGAVYRIGLTMTANGLPMQANGSCGGEVAAREQTLVFTPFENSGESCRTFTAEMAADTMTLGVGGDAVRFRRA